MIEYLFIRLPVGVLVDLEPILGALGLSWEYKLDGTHMHWGGRRKLENMLRAQDQTSDPGFAG